MIQNTPLMHMMPADALVTYSSWLDFCDRGKAVGVGNLLVCYEWIVIPDEGSTEHYLHLFFYQQSKSFVVKVRVRVKPENEAEISEYLTRAYSFLKGLWGPIAEHYTDPMVKEMLADMQKELNAEKARNAPKEREAIKYSPKRNYSL